MNGELNVAFGGQREPLTSRFWLKVFDRVPRVRTARSSKLTALNLDLSDVSWIGHLPLLALCLVVQEMETLHVEDARVTMPANENVRAFLERWRFYDFVRARKFVPVREPTVVYQQAFRNSCVLPIRTVIEDADVRTVAAEMQETGNHIHALLRTAAFLDEEGIRGLADLIVQELCMNAVEHARRRDAYIFGRVSKPDDKVRHVYEENAAPWEAKFFRAIHGEGMTELVLGDGGAGIVQTLAEEASHYGKTSAPEILKWAFEPFSTSKGESGDHTRGLWVVKNEVRKLRGVLYVRTWNGISGGVSAWWDFFNDPGCEEPETSTDTALFGGTQFQILLPQLTEQRPYTFISCDRAAAAVANRELRPVGFQVPPEPSPNGERAALLDTIRRLGPRDVLFIDMSRMNQEAWDRRQVDALGHDISLTGLSEDVHSGLETNFRRIWLLNPQDDTLRRLASSSWVTDLWRRYGILQPVVMSEADPTKPPKVRFVVSDPAAATNREGDTVEARRELYRIISDAFGGPEPVYRSSISSSLTPAERSWVSVRLAVNSPSVEVRPDGAIAPAFDVETLANATVRALLPDTLCEKIEQAFVQQKSMRDRLLYQLPSEKYCANYIDPRILTDLDAPARTAMESWIEEKVAESHASYAVSYTNFASMLLTRASRGNPGIKCLPPLRHYVTEAYEELVRRVAPHASLVVLVAISGSGSTIEKILEHLHPLNVRATVLCLINTQTASQRKNMPLLTTLEEEGRFHCLLTKPIDIYDAIPPNYDKRDVVPIDPETLVPLPPPHAFDSLLSDGEFWSMVAESGGLSIEPITYKGRDYTTLFWMRNIFKSTDKNVLALDTVLDHLADRFGENGPDIICANQETNQALRGTGARARTQKRFPKAKVMSETDPDFERVTSKLEGKQVVIFSAAAYSGNAITRLLKNFATAKRIHICVFLTRIAEPMIASFTRQPKVSFTAFRQLYSGSSESSTGSSRTMRLQNLADYRPSCLSHRLLLFVEKLQQDVESPIGAQDPDSLEIVSTPLPPPVANPFEKGETYRFTSEKGLNDLASLVGRCDDADAPWVYAVLEEAASHFEIARRGLNTEAAHHLNIAAVSRLFEAARTAMMKMTVLNALLLDRLHGRDEISEHVVPAFGHALLRELIRPENPPDLRAACIRSLSKVDRQRLIGELEDIINVARQDRDTELTLALELTKILDNEGAADQLRAGLEAILNRRALLPENETSVAIQCLLNDIGLQYKDRCVTFLPWKEVAEILASEPKDSDRTIRSLIRSIRGFLGPRARILYYYRDDSVLNRFVYRDAWPREEATAPRPVPAKNIAAADLLDDDYHDFYSQNVSDPNEAAYERYYMKLDQKDRDDLKNHAMFLHRVGRRGILRVYYATPDGSGMPQGAVSWLQEAVSGVEGLLSRTDSPLTQIGTFQYRQTVEKFHTSPADGIDPLQEFVQHVYSLLGGDVGSMVVLDDNGLQWSRQAVLPPGEVPPLTFPANDAQRVTVAVAKSRRFKRFDDHEHRKREGFRYDGLVKWAPAWLAMPMPQHDGCRVVLHLWHHIPGWFSQHPDDLINSLSALGGGIAQIKADYDRARDAQLQAFNKEEIDKLAAELRNLTLIAQGLALESRERGSTTDLAELYEYLIGIHQNVEALLAIVKNDHLAAPASDLFDIVLNAVVKAQKDWGEEKFELPVPSAARVDIPIAEPLMFQRTMAELLKNAKSHLRPGSKVYTGVEYEGTGAAVSIEIKNPGYGVAQGEKTKIFDSGGYGLKLARITARRHGGRIEEVGMPGESAVFRLTIPIARGGARP
jgi:signal transduction histidine kinase